MRSNARRRRAQVPASKVLPLRRDSLIQAERLQQLDEWALSAHFRRTEILFGLRGMLILEARMSDV